MKPSLLPTIIIMEDPQAHLRGYSLVGREFFLKEPAPRRTKAKMLDEVEITDEFYVLRIAEYLRVVPEAQRQNFPTEEILIPTFVARCSFRPAYIKGPFK